MNDEAISAQATELGDRPKVLAMLITIRSPSGDERYLFSEDFLGKYELWGRQRASTSKEVAP